MEAAPTATVEVVVEVTVVVVEATGEEQVVVTACPTSEPVCRSRTGVSSLN
jgi:hypothetical protein